MDDNALDAGEGERSVLDHVQNKDTWLRLVFMILYGIVFVISKYVVFLAAAVQFLFKLFTGKVQPQIQGLGFSLAVFLRETTEYLTFRSEQKSYPWADWPSDTVGDNAAPEPVTDPAPTEKPAAAKSSVTKGTRSRKKGTGARKPNKADKEETE
ncbi:MAG: DUF4389 domain-containing protein [Rhodospirillales bacterium]|nr:DUF4389 domain-containing protein [Rhodospirillales bacterium]